MAPTGYRFGDFRLAPAARELWLGPELVALPPKSLDCLIYLVEHRERAVGRDELISAVWGRAEVSDDVLAQTLLRARRAVGDTGNDQRAIRTVPRFGYRWILPVEDVAPEPPRIESVPVVVSRRPWLLQAIALAVAALLVAAVLIYLARGRRETAGGADDHAVLVLPVEVRGGDQEASWIRLGAMDYIASSLRAQTPLKVLPSEQTMLLAAPGTDPADAATLHRLEVATGTRYILAPHATFSGGAWSFVLDAYHRDGVRSYEARAASPLDAANLAVARFAGAIGVHAATPAATTAATELVQRMDAAVLAGDLAEAHRLVDTTPAALKDDPAVRVRTGQIAFRAGQLDAATATFEPLAADAKLAPDLVAQAQMGLGAVAVRRGDFAAAERNYSAAIATLSAARDDPNLLGTAYSGRGVANGARGAASSLTDFARARVEFERAGNRIEAGSVDANVALFELRRGRYVESAAAFDRAIEIFNRFDVRDGLAAALIGKTSLELTQLDGAGALATSERIATLAPQIENPILKRYALTARAQSLLANGSLAAAARVLDELDAGGEQPETGVLRARLALERGDGAASSALIATALARKGDGTIAAIAPSDLALVGAIALRRGGDAAVVERALDYLEASADPNEQSDRARVVELAQGELAAKRNDAGAGAHFGASLAEADRRGAPDAIAGSAIAELIWLLARHDLDQAKAVAGRLVAYAERDYDSARALAAFYRASGDAERAQSADESARKLAGERNPSSPI
ncbi:MAG TPA: winged helix-turn-helix domain-containing protein [Rhodanobacteraceae bacterium]|nr:winged helix-turn-helix domain-containing protein [Rhodanobacteraceae bacterium]